MYAYSFFKPKYAAYCCIKAVLNQASLPWTLHSSLILISARNVTRLGLGLDLHESITMFASPFTHFG